MRIVPVVLAMLEALSRRASYAAVLCAVLALVASGCVKRIPAQAGGDRQLVAGQAAKLDIQAKDLPEGTQVQWSMGDGHKDAGPSLQYAWQRPGKYNLQVTVTDSDGQKRSDEALVEVSRPLLRDILPSTVPWVMWMDKPGEGIPRIPLLLERMLASGQDANSALAAVREILGFDPFTREGLQAAGLDPNGTVAMVGWGDGEGVLLAAALAEGEAGLETLIRLLGQGGALQVTPSEKNLDIQIMKAEGQEQVLGAYAFFRGYVWFALESGEQNPVEALQALLASSAGLLKDQADFGDAVKAREDVATMSFFMSKEWLRKQSAEEMSKDEAKIWDSVGFFRMDLDQDDRGLALTMRLGMAGESAGRVAAAFRSRGEVPPLHHLVEADRHGFLKLSLDLFGFAETVMELSGQAAQWKEMVASFEELKQKTGIDLRTGLMDNIGDTYFLTLRIKPGGLLATVISQGQSGTAPADLFEATLFVQVKDSKALGQVIDGLQKLASKGPVALEPNGPGRWRLMVPELPLSMVLRDGFVVVASSAEAADRAVKALSASGGEKSRWPEVLQSADHQLFVLDLARMVTDFEKAKTPPDMAFVKAMALGVLAKVSGLGLAWVDVVASPEMLTFTFRLDGK